MQPNWLAYQAHPTAREAFNLAGSLWHLTEWITETYHPNASSGLVRDKQDDFRQMCPALGVMRDIVTAYKHARVKHRVSKATDTEFELQGATLYFGQNLIASEHLANFTVIFEDGSAYTLNQLFVEVITFWNGYFNSLRQTEQPS